MVDEPGQLRPLGGGAGDDVGEDADGAGLVQPVMLSCGVLVGGGDAGVAEYVARPSNDGFVDGFANSVACLRGLPDLPRCRSPLVEVCVPPAAGIAPASFEAGIQQTRLMRSALPCPVMQTRMNYSERNGAKLLQGDPQTARRAAAFLGKQDPAWRNCMEPRRCRR